VEASKKQLFVEAQKQASQQQVVAQAVRRQRRHRENAAAE